MNLKIKAFFNSGSERSQLIKKNIFGTFGLRGVSMLTSFILVPLTIGYVSNQLYGVWLAVASVLSWIGLFDVGFGNGLRNRLTENLALGNMDKCQQYVSTTYCCLTLILVPLAAICTICCGLVNWSSLLNVSPALNEDVLQTVRIVVAFSCFTFIAKTLSTILLALQFNALSSLLDTIGQILVLIVIGVLTLVTKGSLLYLALVLTICPLLVYIVASIFLFKGRYKYLCPKFSLVRKELVMDILSLGLKFFIIQIACLVLYGTMNVIISHVSSPEYVTEYNVVYKYLSIPMMVFNIILAPFWSAYTDAYTLKDYGWMKSLYSKLLKMFVGCMLVLLVLSALYPIAFKIWLGDKVEIHISMIIVVSLYVAIMSFCSLNSNVLNGTGCITIQLYGSLIMTVVNIPLALWLGKYMGAEGVVVSVGALNFLGAIPSYIQIHKILNQTARGIWIK